MKRLLTAIGLGLALTLAFAGGGCGKSGTKVSPEVRESMEKGATMKELRERGPKPPNPSMRPKGVQAPGKGGSGQGPGGGTSQPQGGL
ncbi:MAG: hypothetical protein J7M26_09555 [Armatimonadetes bacterium]|nr:hypothetical protein [Armatimonadota bacterium]